MSITKHTPGPWLAERQLKADGTPTAYGWDITAEVKPAPGTHSTTLSVAEARSEANARLIAAAPDLLAACEYLDNLRDVWISGVADRKAMALAFDYARAAIAKATAPR